MPLKPGQKAQKDIVLMGLNGKTVKQIGEHLKNSYGVAPSVLAIVTVLMFVNKRRVAKGLSAINCLNVNVK